MLLGKSSHLVNDSLTHIALGDSPRFRENSGSWDCHETFHEFWRTSSTRRSSRQQLSLRPQCHRPTSAEAEKSKCAACRSELCQSHCAACDSLDWNIRWKVSWSRNLGESPSAMWVSESFTKCDDLPSLVNDNSVMYIGYSMKLSKFISTEWHVSDQDLSMTWCHLIRWVSENSEQKYTVHPKTI